MTIPTPALVAAIVALVAVFGTLIGILFNRVAHLEQRVDKAENLVTRLREWAIKATARYYQHREPGAPDLEPIPGFDD